MASSGRCFASRSSDDDEQIARDAAAVHRAVRNNRAANLPAAPGWASSRCPHGRSGRQRETNSRGTPLQDREPDGRRGRINDFNELTTALWAQGLSARGGLFLGGAAFGVGGEWASIFCMAAWSKSCSLQSGHSRYSTLGTT